tara:strand:- start:4428 stop:5459 length:1032 start_codon:yes stop_codon:yes gene_type:complete
MAYTSANLPTVNQYDVNKTILEPLFLGQDYMQYMDVMPNVAGTIVLDRFQALSGITKAFASGAFSAETGEKGAAVTITPKRMEAEIAFAGNSLFNKMKGQLMRGGHDFDNVDGTVVKNILLDLIGQGVQSDFNRQLWLSTLDSSAPDADFGIYDGIFESAFNASANFITREYSGLSTQADDAVLATGNGVKILQGLYDSATPELLGAGNHVFFVSGDIADDYLVTLEGTGYAAGGYGTLVNGMPQLMYRGIPVVVRRDWDIALAADSTPINGASSANETHRAMLTTKDAFVVATDFSSNSVEQWYSNDNKEYRFRVAYSVGCALKDGKLAVYYTPNAMDTSGY